MKVGEPLGGIAAWCARHARLTLAICAALVAGSVVLAVSTLRPDAGTDTLVDRSSESFEATEQLRERFGDDAIVVLARGEVLRMALSEDLARMGRLERCLAGDITRLDVEASRQAELAEQGVEPIPEVCAEIADLRPALVVYGPGTFVNEAAAQLSRQFEDEQQETAARAQIAGERAAAEARRRGAGPEEQQAARQAAEQAVTGEFVQSLSEIAVQYGLGPGSVPQADNPEFVLRLLFDSRQIAGTPKSRFAYLMPNRESALVSARLRPDLRDAERAQAIELVRRAVDAEPFALDNGELVVSGVPVVVDGLQESITVSLRWLLALAVVVMALTLTVVFRPPGRLVPLAVALGASSLTFGALAALGGSLTMASIAALPVLIGLAVDFSIQFQARFAEGHDSGLEPVEAAAAAARRGGPIIGTALLASSAGFIVLVLSPVPIVRGFGAILVLGVAIAFALALTAGMAATATLVRSGRRVSAPRFGRLRASSARLGAAVAGLASRVRDSVATTVAPPARSALAVAISEPRRVLAVAVLLGAIGWIAGTRTEVVTDINRLVPASLPAVEDVNELQDATGFSGEVNVVVGAEGGRRSLAEAEVVTWMRTVRDRALRSGGYTRDRPRCEDADLCPAVALPDLFAAGGGELTDERVVSLLDAIPPYFSQAVISRDRRTANLAFGIKVGPLDRQAELIEGIRREIERSRSPEGVSAQLAGLPVLAAESSSALDRSRYLLVLAGLLAVALVLLLVYRSFLRALVPLVPVVLATGWSALVLAAMDVSLNPMSATLGALVIAITTEFSVILSARYREERAGGRSVGEALRVTYERTGTAVVASAVTTIAGFGVLALGAVAGVLGGPEPIRMLTDFGLATVVDLSVALAGVLLVLPAALVVSEEWAERAVARRGPAAGRPPATGLGSPRPAER